MLSTLGTDLNQELVDAVKITAEATRYGNTWCPASTANRVTRAICNHGALVPGLAQQLARFIRLADRAGGRNGYFGFVYERLPVLRPEHFKDQIQKAAARGALEGIVKPGEAGVRFLEPELAGGAERDKPFDLSYKQMPAVVAFLDMLHNMLGYPLIGEICAPVMGPRCSGSAAQVGLQLRSELQAWLHPRTVSEHASKLASHISEFLYANHYVTANDKPNGAAIDDECILKFWEGQPAKADSTPDAPGKKGIDGLRLFRNAALRMLWYRDAALLRIYERRIDGAASISQGPAERQAGGREVSLESVVVGDFRPGESNDLEMSSTGLFDTAWESPLAQLYEGPAGRANWMLDKERVVLAHLVHDPELIERKSKGKGTPADDSGRGDDGEDESRKTGKLQPMFSGAPAGELTRTFARYSWFGDVQDGVVNRIKTRDAGTMPLEDGYAFLRKFYRTLAADLDRATKAATWRLLSQRRPAGALMVSAIEPAHFAAALEATGGQRDRQDDDGDAADLSAALVAQLLLMLQARDHPFGRELRAAAETFERAGFGSRDALDPAFVEALTLGAPAALDLQRIVERAADWLDKAISGSAFAEDEVRFHRRLEAMYGVAPALREWAGSAEEGEADPL